MPGEDFSEFGGDEFDGAGDSIRRFLAGEALLIFVSECKLELEEAARACGIAS